MRFVDELRRTRAAPAAAGRGVRRDGLSHHTARIHRLGFAIPVDHAMRIAAELVATGRASHGWLGVQLSTDMATRGARIADVTPGSPAAAAGLTPGAVVTKVDHHVITTGYALLATVQSRAPDSAVTLVFTDTAGNSKTVEVNLGNDQSRQ